MKLHSLSKTTRRSQKRVGRGYGSGKGGHNSGRGTKGQKARNSVPAHFIGSSWVWFKRLPFMRGKSKFNSLNDYLYITLSDLNKFAADSLVDLKAVTEAGLLQAKPKRFTKVKIVANGELSTKLKVALPATKQAVKAITKAGGVYLCESN